MERKCRWGGKRWNFNEGCEKQESPIKKEEEAEVKPEKVEEPKKEVE